MLQRLRPCIIRKGSAAPYDTAALHKKVSANALLLHLPTFANCFSSITLIPYKFYMAALCESWRKPAADAIKPALHIVLGNLR